MTEPTKEQIEAWIHETWGIFRPESNYTVPYAYVARKAAAWAREQALEEAAQACATLPKLHPSPRLGDAVAMVEEYAHATGIAKCIKAIRALKEKP